MTKFLPILFLMKMIVVLSFDITQRVEYDLAGVVPNDVEKIKSTNPSTTSGQCIAVEAAKEFGCALRSKTILFQGLFESVCERHQLCYKCGFALNISPQTCDQMANMQMYDECWKNLDSPSMRYTCARQRFVALRFLRLNQYQTNDSDSEWIDECREKCVVDYFHSLK